jgi:uncharacterized integral membrane protein
MNPKIKNNIRLLSIILIIILVSVFTMQNLEIVTVNFLWLELSMSRAILVIALLLVGFVVGKLSSLRKKHKETKESSFKNIVY